MNSPPKGGVIHDGLARVMIRAISSLGEWPGQYQLVGKVMAYQGYDA